MYKIDIIYVHVYNTNQEVCINRTLDKVWQNKNSNSVITEHVHVYVTSIENTLRPHFLNAFDEQR